MIINNKNQHQMTIEECKQIVLHHSIDQLGAEYLKACKNGYLPMLQAVFDKNPAFSFRTYVNGLYSAIEHSNIVVVKTLANHFNNFTKNAKEKDHQALLMAARFHKHLALTILLPYSNVIQRNDAFVEAALHSNIQSLRFLYDTNKPPQDILDLALCACFESMYKSTHQKKEVIKTLLSYGANPNADNCKTFAKAVQHTALFNNVKDGWTFIDLLIPHINIKNALHSLQKKSIGDKQRFNFFHREPPLLKEIVETLKALQLKKTLNDALETPENEPQQRVKRKI